MYRLHNMYAHDYFEPNDRPEDEDHHQLMDALGELMDVNNDLTDLRKAVALASLVTTLRRWQDKEDWPRQIHIYFVETFPSFTNEIRETILFLLIPQIIKAKDLSFSDWYIDEAIEQKMYALLHLSFIEGALVSDDETMRAMGAYTLKKLPRAYWKDGEQQERREYLFNRTLNDSSSLVRQVIKEKQ